MGDAPDDDDPMSDFEEATPTVYDPNVQHALPPPAVRAGELPTMFARPAPTAPGVVPRRPAMHEAATMFAGRGTGVPAPGMPPPPMHEAATMYPQASPPRPTAHEAPTMFAQAAPPSPSVHEAPTMFGGGLTFPASVHEEPTLYAQQSPEQLAAVHEAPTVMRPPGLDLIMESSLGEDPLPTEAVHRPPPRSQIWTLLAAVLGVCGGGAVVLMLWVKMSAPAQVPAAAAPAAAPVAAPVAAPTPTPPAPPAPAAAPAPVPAPESPPPAAAAVETAPPPSTLQELPSRHKSHGKAKHRKKHGRH